MAEATTAENQLKSLQVRLSEVLAEKELLEHRLEVEQSNVRSLQNSLKELKQSHVANQATAEQDEECRANHLLKKIKELEQHKDALEAAGHDTEALQLQLTQLRQDKIDIENRLEQESEHIVNRLTKEKQHLQARNHELESRLEELTKHSTFPSPSPAPSSPASSTASIEMTSNSQRIAHLERENARLQKRYQLAMDKLHTLEKDKATVESSHEIEGERAFNLARSLSPHGLPPPMGIPGGRPLQSPHHSGSAASGNWQLGHRSPQTSRRIVSGSFSSISNRPRSDSNVSATSSISSREVHHSDTEHP